MIRTVQIRPRSAFAAGAVLALTGVAGVGAASSAQAADKATIKVTSGSLALGSTIKFAGTCPVGDEAALVLLFPETGDEPFNADLLEVSPTGNFSGSLLLKKNPNADAKTPAPTAGSAVALGVGCLTYGKDEPSAVAYDFFTVAGGTGAKAARSTPNAKFTPLGQKSAAQNKPVLANTGPSSKNAPLTAGGTALLALGTGLVLWSRRARTATTTPSATAASE